MTKILVTNFVNPSKQGDGAILIDGGWVRALGDEDEELFQEIRVQIVEQIKLFKEIKNANFQVQVNLH